MWVILGPWMEDSGYLENVLHRGGVLKLADQ